MAVTDKFDIKVMFRSGASPTDCLREVVQSGASYQAAVQLVKDALRLDDEGVEEMESNYLEQV